MRTLSNSTRFAVEVAKSLTTPLPEPQQDLPEGARKYWPAIITAKRRTAWTDLDLALAENLALDLATIDELTAALARDGHVITDRAGRLYANPAGSLLDRTIRRATHSARALQVDANSTGGKGETQRNKNESAREISKTIAGVPDLIARVAQ